MEKNFVCKGIVLVMLLLFIGAGALPSVMSEETQKTQSVMTILPDWTVDDEGDGDFIKIQDAITAAGPGDEIWVYSGTYVENVVVNKPLSLIGIDEELGPVSDTGKPVIDGGGTGDVVNITADDVTISGFTIQNSGNVLDVNDYDSGIQILGNNSIITYNNIANNLAGITNLGYDLGWYTGFNVLISCNTITDNVNRGIGFRYSENTIITCNKISNSDTVCISGLYFHNGVISCNNISTQTGCGYGIGFQTCNDNEISCNSIFGSPTAGFGYGILLYYDSNGNDVTGNTIQNNGVGIRLDNSSNNPNLLYRNNLMNNNINAWDNNYMSITNWDTGSEGNYWDDLTSNPCYPVDGTYCIEDMYGVKNAVDYNPRLVPYNYPYTPSTPTITGPITGGVGDECNYEFVATDANCDCLIYIVDWGDNTPLQSSGLVESGTPITLSHAWGSIGSYTIRAKARNLCGGESSWGTPKYVLIPGFELIAVVGAIAIALILYKRKRSK